MYRILQINEQLTRIESLRKEFDPESLRAPVAAISEHLIEITPEHCQTFSKIIEDLHSFKNNVFERLNAVLISEAKRPID